MNTFQKIKNCVFGLILLIVAALLFFTPEEVYPLVPIIIGLALVGYGISVLVFYLRMARHMVGGKSFLYESIIIIDLALFTMSVSATNNKLVVLFYLLGLYAFTGVIDILRAFEAKAAGAGGWKMKLSRGFVCMGFVIALFIIGFIIGRTDIFVYGICISMVYSGVMRIIGAFKKTDIIYIQ